MEQPQGFEQGDPTRLVCLLMKSIYGLKPSPRQWYGKIDDLFVQHLGMQHVGSPADDCLAFHELGAHITDQARRVDPDEENAGEWFTNDANAVAAMGLSLSNEHLEHVRDCVTAHGM